jgi:SAM-dependent methyltransferase
LNVIVLSSKVLPRLFESCIVIDYDKQATEYAQHRRVHPEVLKNILTDGGIHGASNVLEVGCGTGNYSVALETAVGCSCWGIDPSEQMLSKAKRRSQTIQFQLGKAESLDFPADLFHLVFLVDVIHHVDDRSAYFGEAYRVLKRGGNVCTVTDSEAIIRRRQPLATHFPETVEIELKRYPRLGELRVLMESVGFDAIHETTVEFAYSLDDIQVYQDKAFSSLHLISEEAFQMGMARMERDLREGPIPCVSRYVLLWGTKK